MLFSFDIFDTCVTRTCGKPVNVFHLLASEVVGTEDKSKVLGFVRDRIVAEYEAVDKLNKDCVTIEEIYQYFDTSVFTNNAKEVVMQKEIDIDINSLVAINETKELIQECRKKGCVVFISDMYLPQPLLKKKIIELGIAEENEDVYVSCECGCSKQTGSLFDYVLKKKNVNKKDWKHFGDNINNDYVSPKRRGIKAQLVNTDFSTYENMWINEASILGINSLSIIAGVFRSVRLNNKYRDDFFTSNLLAPLFVSITVSLMQKAYADGVRRLYFASRDTYIWFVIAKMFLPLFDGLEIKYIHLSTKALYPAYIKDEEIERIKTILRFAEGTTIKRSLKLFGFEESEIESYDRNVDLNKRLYKEGDIDKFIVFLKSNNLIKILSERCGVKRQIVKKYLVQEGLLSDDGVKTGLLDLGWNGTSQYVINDLDSSQSVNYYYYGRFHYQRNFGHIGSCFSLAYSDDIPEMDIYFKVIEYCMCRTLEGSTMGYQEDREGKIIPILEDVSLEDSYIEKVRYAHNIVIQGASIIAQYKCIIPYLNVFFYSCVQRTLCQFTHRPPYSIVKLIANDLYYEHLSHKSRVIIKFPLYHYLKRRIKRRLGYKNGDYDMTWMNASIVYTYHSFGEWMNNVKLFSRINHNLKKIKRLL